MKNIVFVGLLSVALLACGDLKQEIQPAELVNQPAKLQVVSFISPQDTTLTAKVTQTRPILSTDSKSVEVATATVTLTEGSQSVRLVYDGKNKYYRASARQFPIVAGKTYTLTVTTPDGRKAQGSCTVPKPVSLATMQFDSLPGGWGSSIKQYFVRVSWKDVPGQEDYYRTTGFFNYTSTQTTAGGQPLVFENEVDNRALITDNGFDGQLINSGRGFMDLTNLSVSSAQTFNTLFRKAAVTVYLLHLDEPYFRYHEAIQRQNATDGNPFAEPVIISSNITGGIGCFGAYNRTKLTITLK